MLLSATDDEGNKLSYRDIREEVDTFMFEVPKEPWVVGGFGFVVFVVVLVCSPPPRTQDSPFTGGDSSFS